MFDWHDPERLRGEAADVRAIARRMSLRTDRERLLQRAAELDASADWLENAGGANSVSAAPQRPQRAIAR